MTRFIFLFLFSCGLQFAYGQAHIKNGKVIFKIDSNRIKVDVNHVEFAKKIVSPDGKSNKQYNLKKSGIYDETLPKPKNYIQLSYQDSMIFQFTKNAIHNVNGIDIYCFNRSLSNRNDIWVSADLESWIDVGHLNSRTAYITLPEQDSTKGHYQYIKIVNQDDNQPTLIKQFGVIKSDQGEIGFRKRLENPILYTTENHVFIKLKDSKNLDGDIISLKLNGKVLKKKVIISKNEKKVMIPLEVGENHLKIIALNDGLNGANTVKFTIVDGLHFYFAQYRILKDKNKTIRIIRTEQ